MRDIAVLTDTMYVDTRTMRTSNKWPWLPKLSYANPHPDFRTHQVLADVVVHALRAGMHPDCTSKGVFSDPDILSRLPSCISPLSMYDAYAAGDNDTAAVRDWKLYEDRPNKPGWISADVGASMTFRVKFGDVPSLSITYLRSYDGMADATVQLNSHQITLHGSWSRKASTSQVFTSHAYSNYVQLPTKGDDSEHYGMIGFSVLPHSTHDVKITNIGGSGRKFKVIQVASC